MTDWRAVVSGALFGAQGLLALADEEAAGRRASLSESVDPWTYAFDRLVAWWTLVVRILVMLGFIFVLTLAARACMVALLASSLVSVTPDGQEGASALEHQAQGDVARRLSDAARDQMAWIIGFPMRPSFLMPFMVWIPLVVWACSLAYAYAILDRRRTKTDRTPDAFHATVALTTTVVGFVFAFVWCSVENAS